MRAISKGALNSFPLASLQNSEELLHIPSHALSSIAKPAQGIHPYHLLLSVWGPELCAERPEGWDCCVQHSGAPRHCGYYAHR